MLSNGRFFDDNSDNECKYPMTINEIDYMHCNSACNHNRSFFLHRNHSTTDNDNDIDMLDDDIIINNSLVYKPLTKCKKFISNNGGGLKKGFESIVDTGLSMKCKVHEKNAVESNSTAALLILRSPIHDENILSHIISFMEPIDRGQTLVNLAHTDRLAKYVIENSSSVWKTIMRDICRCKACMATFNSFEDFNSAMQNTYWQRVYFLYQCHLSIKRQQNAFFSFGIYRKHIKREILRDEESESLRDCIDKGSENQLDISELLNVHFSKELGNHLATRRTKGCQLYHNKKVEFEITSIEQIPDPLVHLQVLMVSTKGGWLSWWKNRGNDDERQEPTIKRILMNSFPYFCKPKRKLFSDVGEACPEALSLYKDLMASLSHMSNDKRSISEYNNYINQSDDITYWFQIDIQYERYKNLVVVVGVQLKVMPISPTSTGNNIELAAIISAISIK